MSYETETTMVKPIFTTKQLVLVALMTAITCIIAPFSIPLPFSPVPISLTNLVLYISIFILGYKLSTVSYLVYLLLGLVGLPVFSGFTGGLGKAAGPTGGYLIGFLFLTIISGLFLEKSKANKPLTILGLLLGTAVTYAFGTAWLCIQMELSFIQGLAIGVFPYLLGDAIKIIIAMLLGPVLRNRLNRFS